MRLPAFETIGHGRRKWRVSVAVLPLSAFKAAVIRTFGESGGRLPAAFWSGGIDRGIYLRLDRTPAQRVRDLKHELIHAVNDWLEAAYPDPED